jgi:hypothetical protein
VLNNLKSFVVEEASKFSKGPPRSFCYFRQIVSLLCIKKRGKLFVRLLKTASAMILNCLKKDENVMGRIERTNKQIDAKDLASDSI